MMHPMTLMSVYTEHLYLRYGDPSSNELTECRPCSLRIDGYVSVSPIGIIGIEMGISIFDMD